MAFFSHFAMILSLVFSIAFSMACLELDISLDTAKLGSLQGSHVSEQPVVQQAQSPQPQLAVIFYGKHIHEKKWIRAMSVSRLFYSRLRNKSGSLMDLLQPMLRQQIQNLGYGITFASLAGNLLQSKPAANICEAPCLGSCSEQGNSKLNLSDFILKIYVERHLLLWMPPVEFIQTPRSRTKGALSIDFDIYSCLFHNKQGFIPGAKAGSETRLTLLWSEHFVQKNTFSSYPRYKKQAIEAAGAQVLQAYLQRLRVLPLPAVSNGAAQPAYP